MSTIENQGWIIASLITSFNSANFELSAIFAKLHQAFIASDIGSNGGVVFQVGVVLVLAQMGVVGEAWPVVKA